MTAILEPRCFTLSAGDGDLASLSAFPGTPSITLPIFSILLDVAEQQQDGNDQEHKPNPAARIMPPSGAVPPSWERADRQQD